jgi:hypothetical protein
MDLLVVEDPPSTMPARYRQALDGVIEPASRHHFSWWRVAAAFFIGLALGSMVIVPSLRPRHAQPSAVLRDAAIASVLPHRSAVQRLASVHTLGRLAASDPSVRRALIERAVSDPTPAVQLAAIDHLGTLELSSTEAGRLARALPGITSPIVQLTLLDLLGSRAEPEVLEIFAALADDPEAEALIRRHAASKVGTSRKEEQA